MDNKVQQNGVSFAPEKVVDLDAYEKSKAEAQAPAEGGTEETKSEETQSSDEKVEQVSAQNTEEVNGETKTDDVKSNEEGEVSLDEIQLKLGEEELSANEFLTRYDQVKTELDKIKGDQFLGKFIEFYENGGDPAEFLQKATIKWDQVNDLQLLKMQFDQENTDLDEEAKQIIFERELVSKYGVNPDGTYDDDDSKEAKVGKQLMKRDAQKLRSAMAEEQKKFMMPQPKGNQQQVDPNAIREELLRDKELESIVKNKSVPVGENFSYQADPEKVIGMMANTGDFWKLFQKPDGSFDKATIAKVFAFALDPKKYDDHILKLGQDIGSESYIKEQKNTAEKGKARVVDKSTDTSAPFVRGGRIMGGNSDDLLKAFVAQKR